MRGWISGEDFARTLFKIREQRCIADRAALDHFEEARAELAFGKGREHVDVNDHELRLVKCAGKILTLGEIYAGLTTDRSVHLREQSGGDLDQWDSAQVAGCSESREVTDYAASEGDDAGFAVRTCSREILNDQSEGPQRLCPFAVRDEYQLCICSEQQLLSVQLEDPP
jgi:hypothetical protein